MASLFENCTEYCKLSLGLKVSVEENTNPVLMELSDLKSYDDRIKFAKNKWELLGEGSSRTAFQLNKDLIIKIAHNEKGIFQNKVEMDPEAQCHCTNPVVLADAQGKYVIYKTTEPLTKEKFKEITGFGFDSFMNALFYKFNNESDRWNPPRAYEEIERYPLFGCLAELTFKTDQQIGDLEKISSYGILDGNIVLRDYGLNRMVFRKLYKSDSDSNSSSDSPTKTSE